MLLECSGGGFPHALFKEQMAEALEQFVQGEPTVDTSHRTLRLRQISHALGSRFLDIFLEVSNGGTPTGFRTAISVTRNLRLGPKRARPKNELGVGWASQGSTSYRLRAREIANSVREAPSQITRKSKRERDECESGNVLTSALVLRYRNVTPFRGEMKSLK